MLKFVKSGMIVIKIHTRACIVLSSVLLKEATSECSISIWPSKLATSFPVPEDNALFPLEIFFHKRSKHFALSPRAQLLPCWCEEITQKSAVYRNAVLGCSREQMGQFDWLILSIQSIKQLKNVTWLNTQKLIMSLLNFLWSSQAYPVTTVQQSYK